MSLLSVAVISLWQRQANNEIEWAFSTGGFARDMKYGDIGIQPRASVDDEKLLEATQLDINDAYDWLKTL